MLEEALTCDDAKHQPSEAAVAMLTFVQVELSAGGAAAEKRFFHLYGALCDRIFGPIQSAKEDFRHKDNGWLSLQNAPKRPSLPSSSPRPHSRVISPHAGITRSVSSSLDSDPIVKLLCTSGKPSLKEQPLPTLIEAISNEEKTDVSFRLPLHALPKVTQDAWLALLEAALGGKPAESSCSENHARLLRSILRKPPGEQTELLQYKQHSATKQQLQPLSISPRGFSSPMMKTASPAKSKTTEELPPNAMLGMLEYYLFMFCRFPLAPPAPSQAPVSRTRTISPHYGVRKQEAYGDTVYVHLFRKYLRHFLPYEREAGRSISFTEATRESELFLRICIALWLESHACVVPTSKVIQSIQGRRRSAGLPEAEPIDFDLHVSYDLVQASNKYQPPPQLVQKCLKKLVIHLVLDPALYKTFVEKNVSDPRLCLGSSMTAMQQPFYNHLRTTLRNAPLHASNSSFFAAFDLWLMWMEPWNLKIPKKNDFSATQARIIGTVSRTPTVPKPAPRLLTIPGYNKPSQYTPAWEAYIAANLYIYTVPLAIFLRRSRELDFSAGKFDKSVEIVKRVFRVFSPAVVDVVSRHLSGQGKFANLVAIHQATLGPYDVPQGRMSLSSCKSDMCSLLEEIHSQHTKKVQELDVFERIGAKLEGLFGKGVVSGEEKAMEGLEDRAKLIVQLPIDYDFHPTDSAGSSSAEVLSTGNKMPSRNKDGSLDAKGREQIISGAVRCNPADVFFVGDKLRSRPASYEISVLVDLTIWASDRANEKLGLRKDGKGPFRVNLRFLADQRNLFFVLFLMMVRFFLSRVGIW